MTGRVQARTNALVAPVAECERQIGAVRDHLVAAVAEAMAHTAPGGLVEITGASIDGHWTNPTTPEEFRWKPAFVRRSLGLALVRACAEGRFQAPATAAEPVVAEALDCWHHTGWRTYHWEPWLAGLAPGARAVVLAEAVNWASALWVAFDWEALGSRCVFGAPNDLWTCPGPRTVRLKGRADIQVSLAGDACSVSGASASSQAGGGHTVGVASDDPRCVADTSDVALISVLSGRPGEQWREELAFPALVAGLRWPSRPVSARVVGLWPDAATVRMVDIDDRLLGATSERVVAAVRRAASSKRAIGPTAA
jgi:hypothetical protein